MSVEDAILFQLYGIKGYSKVKEDKLFKSEQNTSSSTAAAACLKEKKL